MTAATPGEAGRDHRCAEVNVERCGLGSGHTGGHVWVSANPADREAALDQARRDGAALAKIRKLHRRVEVRCFFDDHPRRCTCLDQGLNDYCGECQGHPRWPCPTARAAALAEQGDGG